MASTSSPELPDPVSEVLEQLEALLRNAAPADVDPGAIQRLLTMGVQLYFAKRYAGEDFGPFTDARTVSATEVMVAAANMLEAAEVEVFELGMWKTLSGA